MKEKVDGIDGVAWKREVRTVVFPPHSETLSYHHYTSHGTAAAQQHSHSLSRVIAVSSVAIADKTQ